MTTHTPGPWRIGDAANTIFGPPAGLPPVRVAELCRADNRRANAALIAAAPDLLAALERIANETCDHGAGFCPRDFARDTLKRLGITPK